MKMTYQRDAATGVAQRTFEWPVRPPDIRKLVCLPYAGGNSTAFRPLAEALGPSWQVVAIDPPGTGLSAPEPPLDEVDALCDVFDAQIAPAAYEGGYLLGYSIGGYVAHALVERWERTGRPTPRGLIMCAVNPPNHRDTHPVFSAYDDEHLLDLLAELGGLPPALREERAIFDMFKHVVRAGFRAYERAPEPRGTVRIPVMMIGGRGDVLAPPANLDGWRAFCRRYQMELVDGPHVFLPDQRGPVAQLITGFAEEVEDAAL